MAKGQQFERDICKQLSLWWSEGNEDDIFWRTSGSGARATVRTKAGKTTRGQYGDLMAVDNRGKFFTELVTIEFKRGYQKTTFADLIDQDTNSAIPQFAQWVYKAIETNKKAGCLGWMLITQRNRKKAMVFMANDIYHALWNAGALLRSACPLIEYSGYLKKVMKGKKVVMERTYVSMVGMPLDVFLKRADQYHFRKAALKWRKKNV